MSTATIPTAASTLNEPSGDSNAEMIRKSHMIQSKLEALYPSVPKNGFLNHSDPFTLLIAHILSAQTSDEKVNEATAKLFVQAKTPDAMVALGIKRVQDIIQPVGSANAKAKTVFAVSNLLKSMHKSKVPNDFATLEKLNGVGRTMASVVMLYAFNKPVFPIDSLIYRLACRWGFGAYKSVQKTEANIKMWFPDTKSWAKLYARFILFAREHCSAAGHDMEKCPICSFAATEEARASNEKSPEKFVAPEDCKDPYNIRSVPDSKKAVPTKEGDQEAGKEGAVAHQTKEDSENDAGTKIDTPLKAKSKEAKGEGEIKANDNVTKENLDVNTQNSQSKTSSPTILSKEAPGKRKEKKMASDSTKTENGNVEMADQHDKVEDPALNLFSNGHDDDPVKDVPKQQKGKPGKKNTRSKGSEAAITDTPTKASRASTRTRRQPSSDTRKEVEQVAAETPPASKRQGRKRKVREDVEVANVDEEKKDVEDNAVSGGRKLRKKLSKADLKSAADGSEKMQDDEEATGTGSSNRSNVRRKGKDEKKTEQNDANKKADDSLELEKASKSNAVAVQKGTGNDNIESETVPEASKTNGAEPAAQAVVKRGRGRPKKTSVKAKGAPSAESERDDDREVKGVDVEGATTARKGDKGQEQTELDVTPSGGSAERAELGGASTLVGSVVVDQAMEGSGVGVQMAMQLLAKERLALERRDIELKEKRLAFDMKHAERKLRLERMDQLERSIRLYRSEGWSVMDLREMLDQEVVGLKSDFEGRN